MSAVALKPAPKAGETALLFGFVSIFCYDMYAKKIFWQFFVTKRLAVGSLCHEVVVCHV